MDQCIDTAYATQPGQVGDNTAGGDATPQTRIDHCRTLDTRWRASAYSTVAASFALYEIAREALDEARLWFSEEDCVCIRAFMARESLSRLLEQGGQLLIRVRDSKEASRAVDILLGRGAIRIDILRPDAGAPALLSDDAREKK